MPYLNSAVPRPSSTNLRLSILVYPRPDGNDDPDASHILSCEEIPALGVSLLGILWFSEWWQVYLSWLAGHGLSIAALFLSYLRVLVFPVFRPESDVALTAVYFLLVIVVVVTALAFYWLLRHYLPGFTHVVTGGR